MASYEAILQRMKRAYEEQSGRVPEDASDLMLRLQVLAGELYGLQCSLEWLRRQAFPQTALGAELELHAGQRGLHRREAEAAKGTLSFRRTIPIGVALRIAKGTVVALSADGSMEYETTEEGTLQPRTSSVDIPARALVKGRRGNAAPGTIGTLVTRPMGIENVINQAAFTGGREAETDEELRKRLLESYSLLPNGTNAEFYRRCALECPGVASACAVARENGIGTVGVYLWGDGAAPAADAVQAVKERLEALREINVDVTVRAASPITCDVYVFLKPLSGTTMEKAAEQAELAVREYFALQGVGGHVYKAELGAAIMGRAPVSDYSFASTVRDIAPSGSRVPVLGTFTAVETAG